MKGKRRKQILEQEEAYEESEGERAVDEEVEKRQEDTTIAD